MKFMRTLNKPQPLRWLSKHNWHKHPMAIPIATGVVLFFAGLGLFVLNNGEEVTATDSHLIVVSYDKKQETVPTRAKTVGEFLERADIVLNEGDVVEPSKNEEIIGDKFRVNVYRARPVVLVDGDKRTFAFSAATTPRSVANQAGVDVHPEDKIESKMETNFIKDNAIGEKVVIDRAAPVNLNLYGNQVPLRTHAETVGDLLKEKDVKLAKDDTVQPSLDTKLTADLQVFVTRNGVQIVTAEEPIAMKVESVEDSSLSFGATAVRQKGSDGKKIVTYELELKNGVEVGRRAIQEVVAQQPVTQIVARGKAFDVGKDKASIMRAAGIAESDFRYVDYIISKESGWRHTVSNGSSGAYGLCQALPGSKMGSAGGDWRTNPVTQLKWCSGYAKSRYGGWGPAYNAWVSKHWW